MDGYVFFFSYARSDGDDYLKRFYKELVGRISQLTGIAEERVGFIDSGIEPGDVWEPKIVEALRTSHVFVPLYTPRYFTREYCGKEWQVFRNRLNDYMTKSPLNRGQPPLVVPILWVPLENAVNPVPAIAKEIQYKHDDYGSTYAKEGLLLLRRQYSRYKGQYEDFIDLFAKRIIDVYNQYKDKLEPLDPLQLPDMRGVQNAFGTEQQSPAPNVSNGNPSPGKGGPGEVVFVVAAGRRDELRGTSPYPEAYGEYRRSEWQPYFPEHQRYAGSLVQEYASCENFISRVEDLDDEILDRIEKAESDNNILVLVVDAWTLHLASYKERLNDYGERNSWHSALLVIANTEDPTIGRQRAQLENWVNQAFDYKIGIKDPFCIANFDATGNPDKLRQVLVDTLVKVKANIINKSNVPKPAQGPQGETVPQPILPVA